MDAMTVLPTWAVWVVSLGGPVGAALGVVVTTWAARRNAGETETRSRREETMRTLRWAAELAISADEDEAALGVAELRALSASTMNDDQQQAFVDAALAQALAEPRSAIEEAEAQGVEAEVVLEPTAEADDAVGAVAPGPGKSPSSGVAWVADEQKEAPGGEEDRGGDPGPTSGGQGPR